MTTFSPSYPSASYPSAIYPFVYLASQSPRRAQLLTQLGVQHQPLLPAEDEDAEGLEALLTGERPSDYVQRVTGLKLHAAVARLKARGLVPAPVLCADTTVALGTRILGKPADAVQARAMLQALSNRSHRVLTAVAVHDGKSNCAALSVSRVRFALLPASVIEAYIDSGDCFGKAGSYAIQSALAGWVTFISGSYSGIMGLPLHETAQLLQTARVATALTP